MNLTTTSADSGADSVTWVIYGKAGSGKTSMLATVPDATRLLYLNLEGGLIPPALAGTGAPQVRWQMLEQSAEQCLRDVYRHVTRGEGAGCYDWIAIDSLSALAEDVLARELAVAKDPRQAYGGMADSVKALVRAYRALPINVLMICKAATAEQPEGGVLGCPQLPGKQLREWLPHEVDGIFALLMGVTGKGDEQQVRRYLKTRADGRHEAKDRSDRLGQIEQPDLSVMHSKVTRGLAPKEQ